MSQETYDEFINGIIYSRGRFECGDRYHERHHIVPKCKGGTNDRENLIDLYPDEHLIAHRLLSEENPEDLPLMRAYALMAFGMKNQYHERHEASPEEYARVRENYSSMLKERLADPRNHPCYGKRASEETRRKQSERAKERLKDPTKNPMYGKFGVNNPNFGRKCSAEQCAHQSEIMKKRMETVDFNGANNPRAKKVIRLSDGMIYSCGKDAAAENGIKYTSFKGMCQKHRDFMYYDEYINNNLELS